MPETAETPGSFSYPFLLWGYRKEPWGPRPTSGLSLAVSVPGGPPCWSGAKGWEGCLAHGCTHSWGVTLIPGGLPSPVRACWSWAWPTSSKCVPLLTPRPSLDGQGLGRLGEPCSVGQTQETHRSCRRSCQGGTMLRGSGIWSSRAATLSLGPPTVHDSILSENTEARGCKQATRHGRPTVF